MNPESKNGFGVTISEGTTPEDKVYYKTTDIAHAAALLTCGHKLAGVSKVAASRKRGSKKTEFIFMREGVDEALLKYSNGDLQVDAKALLENFRNLKATSFGKGVK